MAEKVDRPHRGGRRILLVIFFLILLAAGATVYWHLFLRGIVFSDDARLDGDLLDLSPKISGTLTHVFVNEGDYVDKGKSVFLLDKRALEAALAESMAQLDSAKAKLAVAQAEYQKGLNGPRPQEIRIAEEAEKRAELEWRHARREWERVKDMKDGQIMTESARAKLRMIYETAEHTYGEAKTRLALLREGTRKEDLAVAQANVQLRKADLAAAEAAVRQAQVNLDHTEVHAPFAGVVVRRWRNPGEIVPEGRPIVTILDPNSLHVAANVEEKYLSRISVGDSVDISVDAYPNLTLTGRLEKILRATNSQFGLIPSDGASGTFIKVAQRVPVRIRVESHPDLPLGPGLSVEIRIKISEDKLSQTAIAGSK